jgi:hypothetical protein
MGKVGPTNMALPDWTVSDKRYALWLSQLRFGHVMLKTAQYNRHFTSLPARLDDATIPFGAFERDVDAFVLRPQPVAAPLPLMTWLPKVIRYAPMHYRRSYTDLTTTFDDYTKKFSSKTRNEIKRNIRRYAEHVKDENPVRRFEGVAGITEFHALARTVAKKTYQEKLVGGGLPGDEHYLREMRRLAAAGNARGYLMMHGARPVAYLYLIAHSGVLHSESTGYDPAYKEWSVGASLLYAALKDLFDEHEYPLLDYGEQESAHKELFGTHHALVAHVFYFMRRPKPLAVVTAQAGLHKVGKELKGALGRWKMDGVARRIVGSAPRASRAGAPSSSAAPGFASSSDLRGLAAPGALGYAARDTRGDREVHEYPGGRS